MSKTPADSIFDLPQEIIFNILSRLPVKSLLQFRCVCTSAPPLISHPSFTKLHLTSTVADRRAIILYRPPDQNNNHHHYSLLSPPTFHETLKLQFPVVYREDGCLRYAGSNKGLICLYYFSFDPDPGALILWNPSINKYKILDGPHNPSSSLRGHTKGLFSLIMFGFGFVSRTCEFKVVGIVYPNDSYNMNNEVFVYSLSTNSWEVKEGVSAPCYIDRYCRPTCVNGFVNWLADGEDEARVIMAFDLDNERFKVYDLPKDIGPNYDDDLSLNSFGEEDSLSLSLSLCACYLEGNVEKWDVWVMGEYGVVDSWKKVFAITNHDFFSFPPLVMKSDREVLISASGGRLMLFDAIKNQMQDLVTRLPDFFSHALSYTASLALLDG